MTYATREEAVEALRLRKKRAKLRMKLKREPRGISVEEFLMRKRIEAMEREKRLNPKTSWFEVAHAAFARPTQEHGGVW